MSNYPGYPSISEYNSKKDRTKTLLVEVVLPWNGSVSQIEINYKGPYGQDWYRPANNFRVVKEKK